MSNEEQIVFPNSSSNPRPIENLLLPSSKSEKRRLPSLTPGRIKEGKINDLAYVKNLQAYVKELSEENRQLKIKNAELEALFAAAHDEIEEHEKALLELSNAYEDLLKKNESSVKRKKKNKKSRSDDSDEQVNK